MDANTKIFESYPKNFGGSEDHPKTISFCLVITQMVNNLAIFGRL